MYTLQSSIFNMGNFGIFLKTNSIVELLSNIMCSHFAVTESGFKFLLG